LPPKRLCSIQFLRDILSGKKKYFYTHDIAMINVCRIEHLTVKSVLDKIYNMPDVRVYLPDFDTEPEKRINRDYLFAIVHKLDPSFFKRVTEELHTKQRLRQEQE
jgi:hypothetical protein